jgi:hypothetical protein
LYLITEAALLSETLWLGKLKEMEHLNKNSHNYCYTLSSEAFSLAAIFRMLEETLIRRCGPKNEGGEAS